MHHACYRKKMCCGPRPWVHSVRASCLVGFDALLRFLRGTLHSFLLQFPSSSFTITDNNIFKYGNRNAASHLWSTFLMDRAVFLTERTFLDVASGYCAVSGSPVTPHVSCCEPLLNFKEHEEEHVLDAALHPGSCPIGFLSGLRSILYAFFVVLTWTPPGYTFLHARRVRVIRCGCRKLMEAGARKASCTTVAGTFAAAATCASACLYVCVERDGCRRRAFCTAVAGTSPLRDTITIFRSTRLWQCAPPPLLPGREETGVRPPPYCPTCADVR